MILFLLLAALTSLIAADGDWAKRYTLPHQVTAFREADNGMTIDISYAVPRAGVRIAGGNRDVVHIEQALTVVDTLGITHHESWARPTALPPAGTSAVRRNYMLANEQILLAPREYEIHLGVRDLKIKSTGSFHVVCTPPGADGKLDLSDLLLATNIIAGEEPPSDRSDLVIRSNPLRLYQYGERVFAYLELYNLRRDEFGQTNFEIAYQMERPKRSELDPELFEAIDRNPSDAAQADGGAYLVPRKHRKGVQVEKTWSPGEGQATIATRYVGHATRDLTWLEFEVGQLASGIHKLTIRATDLNVHASAEKSTLFRILNE